MSGDPRGHMESFLGDSGPYLVLMKVGPHFSEDLIRIMYSFIMVKS